MTSYVFTSISFGLLLAVAGETAEPDRAAVEADRRNTAVALNYCRASFHRIRRNPSKRVLLEEEKKILNNLDLSRIGDEEVIKLYSSVLDEIRQVQLAEKEQKLLDERYRLSIQRQLFASAMLFGTEAATGQVLGAVRTGANSWWDYRTTTAKRDLDSWRVDKQRMTNVGTKSASFLESFWKLTKQKQIPDRWLIRSDDLVRLDQAAQQADPVVRLRVMRRMERFMECYPPYWYYVARTQQQLGQLFAARKTYRRLVELGDGHFRKDEMLAAALANEAVIQVHLGRPDAAEIAIRALDHSTACWEANLLAARVLAISGRSTDAEDAILRNLDVNLERPQSLVLLLSLYYRNGDDQKLIARLNDAAVCRDVPVPVLLRCAARIGDGRLPAPLMKQITSSLAAVPRLRFGTDDVVVFATPGWQLSRARLVLTVGDRQFTRPQVSYAAGRLAARFRDVGELGNPLARTPSQATMTLSLEFPDTPRIRIALSGQAPPVIAGGLTPAALSVRSPTLRITAIDIDEVHLTLLTANEEE